MRLIENPDLRDWVKDSLCRVVFQKAHELAVQTGCEILIKLENTADHSGQFYATSALNQQYQGQGLSKQPWDVRVCGATGLPEAVLVETGCQSGEMLAFDNQSANRGAIGGKHSKLGAVAQCLPEAMLVEIGCQSDDMSPYSDIQTVSQSAIGGKHSEIAEVEQRHIEVIGSNLDESVTGTLCPKVENPIVTAMLPLQNGRSTDISNLMVDDGQVLAEVPNSWPSEVIPVENESATDNRIVSIKVESIKQEIVEPVDCDFNSCSFAPFVMPDLPVNQTYTPAVPRVMQDTTDIVPSGIAIDASYPTGVFNNPDAFTQECSPTIDIDPNITSTSEITVSATENSVNFQPYKCGTCCKWFSAINRLRAHVLQEHGMAMRTSSSLQCNICGLGFKMAMNLQRHMRKHKISMPHACKVCQKEFFDLDSLLRHELIHSRSYRCKVFPRQTNMKVHIYRKRGGLVATNKPRPPVDIGKPSLPATAPPQSLLDHVAVPSTTSINSQVIPANQSPLDTRPLTKPTPRSFECDLCGKSYRASVSLKNHLASHFGIRPYKCKLCLTTYVRRSELKDHMMRHSKIYPHLCEICGKGYKRPCILRQHIKSHYKSNAKVIEKD